MLISSIEVLIFFAKCKRKRSVWTGYTNVSKRMSMHFRTLSWWHWILHFCNAVTIGNKRLYIQSEFSFPWHEQLHCYLEVLEILAFGMDLQTFLNDCFRISGNWVGYMGFFTFCNAGTIEIYVYTSSRSAHLSFLRSDYITLLTRFTRTMSRELHQLVRVVRAAKIQRSYHSYHSYSFLVGTPARIGRSGTRINFRRSPRCFDTKPGKMYAWYKPRTRCTRSSYHSYRSW